ncbi:unnamed protein product [Allacma fusca]|uniref:Uncharacterized protein n=1 Tax=Allacma fusca TaxID=39272 RepID=A0A8J2LXW0_9HEXA|nr:unnamed protein product [Allacma fusca]
MKVLFPDLCVEVEGILYLVSIEIISVGRMRTVIRIELPNPEGVEENDGIAVYSIVEIRPDRKDFLLFLNGKYWAGLLLITR